MENKCEDCGKDDPKYVIDTCFGRWEFCSKVCLEAKKKKLGYEGSIFNGKELKTKQFENY